MCIIIQPHTLLLDKLMLADSKQSDIVSFTVTHDLPSFNLLLLVDNCIALINKMIE